MSSSNTDPPVLTLRSPDKGEQSFNVYGDPDEPNIISDEESSKETDSQGTVSCFRKRGSDFSFATRLQKAASEGVEDGDDNDDDTLHVTAKNTTQKGNLVGILEVSKFFIHDNCADHDAEIECGVASGLSTLLRRSIFLYEQALNESSNNQSTRYLGSGLEYIASLSTSLAMVLHCSRSVLEDHIQQFQLDLIPALQSMAENFARRENGHDAILVQVVLTNLCRIISLIHVALSDRIETFLEILLSIVKGESIAADVKATAAVRVCEIIETYPLDVNPKVRETLEDTASMLISAVSTASAPISEGDQNVDPTLRLYDLAAISDSVCVKVMKRRCSVLCITRHFRHSNSNVRRQAYSFCQNFLNRSDVSSSYSSGLFMEDKLVEALAESASSETDPDIQLLAGSLLHSIIKLQPFPSATAMSAIRDLAYSGQSDEVVVESGSAYCEGMTKEPFPTLEFMSTVVDFTTFPFSNIRSEAFDTLETLLTKSESVKILLDETELLENFGLIVSHGEDSDCEAALNIIRQLSRSSRNHSKMCQNSTLLGILVDFVAKENVTNRIAHFYGVEIILALLSNDDNTESFLPFRHLLPWLVNFLNRTTAEDSFKERLVAVILRLSTAYLERED
jgi:hypothetical protein